MSRQEVQSLLDRYVAAYRAGDAAGCAECFSEDARLLSPYAPPAQGRAAIASLHADWVQDGQNKCMTLLESGFDGSLAWALASYSEGEATGTGTSLCVFRKDPDGAWKIHMCSLNETLSA